MSDGQAVAPKEKYRDLRRDGHTLYDAGYDGDGYALYTHNPKFCQKCEARPPMSEQTPLTPYGQAILDRFRVALYSARPLVGEIKDPFEWMRHVACKVLEEVLATPNTLRQDSMSEQTERMTAEQYWDKLVSESSYITRLSAPKGVFVFADALAAHREAEVLRRVREALDESLRQCDDPTDFERRFAAIEREFGGEK